MGRMMQRRSVIAMQDNAAARSAVKRLLLQMGGADPIAQASAESEIRRLGLGALPVISAVAAEEGSVPGIGLVKAASYVLGSGFVASLWEHVRRYQRYWPLMGVVAAAAAILLIAGYVLVRRHSEQLRRGIALAVLSIGDAEGARVLLEMVQRSQTSLPMLDALAALLRRMRPEGLLFTEAQVAGLRNSLALAHHDLRMEALRLVRETGDTGAIPQVTRIARSRSRSVDALQEREEAARTLEHLTWLRAFRA